MTVIYPSPIFGPIHSRRLGISLGINLLPVDGKICTFDCLYCECGFNNDHRPTKRMPSEQEVMEALEKTLIKMSNEGTVPDVLTFAGNGEPTVHPHFPEIIEGTIKLRDKYFPKAKVSVLSNATMISKPSVFKALKKVDNNILKLDTINDDYIRMLDRPTNNYSVSEIIDGLKAFEGKCIIQTMFLKGEHEGEIIDNTTDKYVMPWLEAIKIIAPSMVMVYTIDRETPAKGLLKATHDELDRIGDLVKRAGIECSVSY